jgi:hypothetical protein
MNNRLDMKEIVLTMDRNLLPRWDAQQSSVKPQHDRKCAEQK